MASFPRLLGQLTSLRPIRTVALMALASVALISSAAPTDAAVTKVGGLAYGVQPEVGVATPATPLAYGGGEVVHSNAPYAIYWDPADLYSGAWQSLTAGYLKNMGAESRALTNVNAVATQYRDNTGANASYNSGFHGAFTDVEPYSTPGETSEKCVVGEVCLTDAQIRAQLTKYIAANPHLPKGLNPSTGPTPIYFIFTPPKVNVCLDKTSGNCSKEGSPLPFCSYHSYVSVEGVTVLYAVEPTTGGARTACQDGSGILEKPNLSPADIFVNGLAAQLIATTTDPLLTGWHDSEISGGNEVPDKCRNEFLPLPQGGTTVGKEFNQTIRGAHYYLNDEFNQAAIYDPFPGNPCLNEVTVAPRFTASNTVHSEEEVTFNASESYVDLGIVKYNWDFGDGTTAEVDCQGHTPSAGYHPAECTTSPGVESPNPVASMKHSYTYGGTYPVTLKVTDDGGNEAAFTEPVAVQGPAREAPATGGAVAAPPAQAGASGSGAAAGTRPVKPIVSPVATQAAVSRSLRSVLRHGLVVRYSVSEQVVGRFEVLLASSTARRIGLHGSAATGLAAGTPAQLVIGKAILVTTKGGRSNVAIQFDKKTAARLGRLRHVSLMLRLVVRNAGNQRVTVLSTVTLSH